MSKDIAVIPGRPRVIDHPPLLALRDTRGAVSTITSGDLAQIVTNPASWIRFLQMACGGPPARMTVHASGGTVSELSVVTSARRHELRA